MKVDWNLAPEWANYAAMTSDGKWYWFENRPITNDKLECWQEPHNSLKVGRNEQYNPRKYWKDSLTKRKEEND